MTEQSRYRHGPTMVGDSLRWQLWAPRADRVEMILKTKRDDHVVEMTRTADGWFHSQLIFYRDVLRYAFRLNGGRILPDTASRWQPDGVHKPSALFFPEDFAWTDSAWRGVHRADLVFYELHVGTFTEVGTFDAIIPRLPELRDLGVTAIELMPVGQFPGERNWGYDGVHPFAVQNTYGGPRGLQRLIDASHREGIAVFLDVVYNHLGPEGNYFGEFGPYFTAKYQTPWGAAWNFDDEGSDVVRQLICENVRYWLREFHVDGLRLDAVHAIFDHSETHILREIQCVAEIEAAISNRRIHIVAESSLNDARLVDSIARHGYDLAAQWNDDFHHSVHAMLTGERDGYYVDFGHPKQLAKAINDGFVYDGCYSEYRRRVHGTSGSHLSGDRFVVSVQNHDQIGNRAVGDRFGSLLTVEQQRLSAGLLLLSPFLPLIFMGEEYGERNPFPFFCSFSDDALIDAVRRGRRAEFDDFQWPNGIPDPQDQNTFASAKLSWKWSEHSRNAGLRRWYQALLRLRREISSREPQQRIAVWHERSNFGDEAAGILELMRGVDWMGTAPPIVVYFNFSEHLQDLSKTFVDRGDKANWLQVLSSEWPQFGGRHHDCREPDAGSSAWRLLPYEVLVFSSKSYVKNRACFEMVRHDRQLQTDRAIP